MPLLQKEETNRKPKEKVVDRWEISVSATSQYRSSSHLNAIFISLFCFPRPGGTIMYKILWCMDEPELVLIHSRTRTTLLHRSRAMVWIRITINYYLMWHVQTSTYNCFFYSFPFFSAVQFIKEDAALEEQSVALLQGSTEGSPNTRYVWE